MWMNFEIVLVVPALRAFEDREAFDSQISVNVVWDKPLHAELAACIIQMRLESCFDVEIYWFA